MKKLIKVHPVLRPWSRTRGGLTFLLLLAVAIAQGEESPSSVGALPTKTETFSSPVVAAPGQSQFIYKSVDAQGRVSFGDQPGANAVELETLERPMYQNSSTEELQTRLEQMAATTKRLQADRKLRANLRRDKVESRQKRTTTHNLPVVVVEKRSYRPRHVHPYLYNPRHYTRTDTHLVDHAGPLLGLRINGGGSRFHYGLSYSSQRRYREGQGVQTPYRLERGSIHSSGLLKRHHK